MPWMVSPEVEVVVEMRVEVGLRNGHALCLELLDDKLAVNHVLDDFAHVGVYAAGELELGTRRRADLRNERLDLLHDLRARDDPVFDDRDDVVCAEHAFVVGAQKPLRKSLAGGER